MLNKGVGIELNYARTAKGDMALLNVDILDQTEQQNINRVNECNMLIEMSVDFLFFLFIHFQHSLPMIRYNKEEYIKAIDMACYLQSSNPKIYQSQHIQKLIVEVC